MSTRSTMILRLQNAATDAVVGNEFGDNDMRKSTNHIGKCDLDVACNKPIKQSLLDSLLLSPRKLQCEPPRIVRYSKASQPTSPFPLHVNVMLKIYSFDFPCNNESIIVPLSSINASPLALDSISFV